MNLIEYSKTLLYAKKTKQTNQNPNRLILSKSQDRNFTLIILIHAKLLFKGADKLNHRYFRKFTTKKFTLKALTKEVELEEK